MDIFGRLIPIWLVALVAGIASAAGATCVTRAIYVAKVEHMVAAQALAVSKAVNEAAAEQKRVDKVSMDAAVSEAEAQQKEVIKTVTITKWITRHVKDIPNCPSLDLVRLHDAAALGADPESLSDATGQSNVGSTDVTTTAFSEAINDNYGACRANAEQLTALQAWELKREASP